MAGLSEGLADVARSHSGDVEHALVRACIRKRRFLYKIALIAQLGWAVKQREGWGSGRGRAGCRLGQSHLFWQLLSVA